MFSWWVRWRAARTTVQLVRHYSTSYLLTSIAALPVVYPLKSATIENVYIKSALETMPEVLEALSTAVCAARIVPLSYHAVLAAALHTLLPLGCCWAEGSCAAAGSDCTKGSNEHGRAMVFEPSQVFEPSSRLVRWLVPCRRTVDLLVI